MMKTSSTSELLKMMSNENEKSLDARIVGLSSPEGRNEILVYVEICGAHGNEKKSYLVPMERFDSVMLSPKRVPYAIDTDTLECLEGLDALASALHRAYGILAYGSCSHKKLCRKLIEKGIDREIAAEAVAIVSDKGYIDENSLAIRLCELCLKKYWGKSKIIQKLREEGYDEEAVDCAIEYLSEIDFSEQCALLIQKRYLKVPSDRYEMQKMCASISRYGYNGSEIKGGIQIFRESFI